MAAKPSPFVHTLDRPLANALLWQTPDRQGGQLSADRYTDPTTALSDSF